MIVDAAILDRPSPGVCRPAAWPETLEQHFVALQKRWLLRNERVSILLAGLDRSHVMLGPWRQACLLVVTFGQLCVKTDSSELSLVETDSLVIAPHARYQLHAPEAADFLLMNLNPPNPSSSRCLCHGAAARNEIFEAARQFLGVQP